jgi:hypothetical protein
MKNYNLKNIKFTIGGISSPLCRVFEMMQLDVKSFYFVT